MNINIKQEVKALTRNHVDSINHLILVLPDTSTGRKLPKFPYAEALKQRLQRSGQKPDDSHILVADLPNKIGTHVVLAFIKPDTSSFELLSLGRKLAAKQFEQNPRSIALSALAFKGKDSIRIQQTLVAALLAGGYELPNYKSKKEPAIRLKTIHLLGSATKVDMKRTLAEAEGNNLARALTVLPPNELTPAIYRKRIAKLAREHGWQMRFLDSKALKRHKAGAFLAVAQGSADDDAGIVQLRYTSKGTSKKPLLCLIGKGICFDTGGTNLKPAKYMHGMHEDMQGSAVALGTLLALTKLKVDFPVQCWLALAQNHIGPRAYKQNDVVTACNGTTIEIMHTDAEGRMVLADTLTLASRQKPKLMIDYATLTGACVYSLSSRYSGAFTNRDKLTTDLIAAGRSSGERVWPFPIDKDFDKDLESKIADVKQCTLEGDADHILAARFLNRFVNNMPWVHIDLAASNRRGGLAHIPTDTTGFGIRFTTDLLLDKQVMKKV